MLHLSENVKPKATYIRTLKLNTTSHLNDELPIYDSQYILLVIINWILKKIVEVKISFNDFFSSEKTANLVTFI